MKELHEQKDGDVRAGKLVLRLYLMELSLPQVSERINQVRASISDSEVVN